MLSCLSYILNNKVVIFLKQYIVLLFILAYFADLIKKFDKKMSKKFK